MIFNNSCKYAQIRADTSTKAQRRTKYVQMRADTRKYAQIHANTRKYEQVHAHTCKYAQIHANTSKYTQIHGYTQMLHNRVTSAARERAQRAQRAKRRKDTANSHEQLQGAPFSSVRRHVPASLIIITRFPFTYQTGFKGIKNSTFFSHRFLHRFWGRFGLSFWTKNQVFVDDFLHQFPSFDFYVIIDVFWSVFGPLDIPKSRFNCRKTAIFMDLHVFAKLSILSIIPCIFGRFRTPFLTYFRILFGYSFIHRFLMSFGPKMVP